jgi:O-antigen/teichoic acid export membrane protein
MVNTSQTILIAPLMGLEAAAIWAVCIRPFTLVIQLVWRVLDFSATPLSEMLVRGEHERFFNRFRGVTVLTGAMAVVAGVMFAVCNQPFVQFWTQGKLGWSVWNDVLLALWGVFVAVQRCHCGLLGVRKDFRLVKYVYFGEGAMFAALALLAARPFGFTGLIGSSLIATVSMSFFWGLWRTRADFGLTWPQVIGWLEPAGKILVVLAPVAAVLRWAVVGLAPLPTVILLGTSLGLLGGWLLFRHGLDQPMKERFAARVPGWMKALLLTSASRPSA